MIVPSVTRTEKTSSVVPAESVVTETQTPIISVRNRSVRYGTVEALNDVSIELLPGRIVGVIGMNGSGKSSLYSAIMGSVKFSSGSVRLFGEEPAAERKHNLVSYVPQSEAVDWDFPISVAEVVMTGRYGRMGVLRRASAADREAVEHAIERVGLTDLTHRQIAELSGGQRKRVFVARGIAQEASLLLLDEPFAGVDKASEYMIIDLLRSLADEGRGIVISTHDLVGVPELCNEVVLLKNRVLFHGSPIEALSPERLSVAFGLDPK